MRCYSLIKNITITTLCRIFSLFITKDTKYLAFGAWGGELYSDNSKYLLEECLKKLDSSYHFIWIGNEKLRNVVPDDDRIEICKKDSFEAIINLLKCKYIISSQLASVDISSYNIYWNSKLILLYHGFPIKKIGADIKGSKGKRSHTQYDYFLASSPVHAEKLLSAFRHIGCTKNNILPYGTPRNDFLINLPESSNKDLKIRFKEQYNISTEKKIILYMPTFRRSGKTTGSLWLGQDERSKNKLLDLLKEYNYVLVEKAHYIEQKKTTEKMDISTDYYINVKTGFDTQELLACADILISDYSSALVDYLLLDRPILHYVYDYDFYKDIDSGLYYDLEDFACGMLAYDYDELIEAIKVTMSEEDRYKDLRSKQRKRFLGYETGTSSVKLINNVLAQD